MRFGHERLGGIVRERTQAEPLSRALFVFVGKRGHRPGTAPELGSIAIGGLMGMLGGPLPALSGSRLSLIEAMRS